MVTIKLLTASSDESITVGPAPWFRVAGNFIRQGPHGEIMGTFRNHHWEVASRQFIVITCKGPVAIHFEDAAGGATSDYGPFEDLHARDGALFAEGEPFAKFIEESQLWHCYSTANFWPVLVLKSPKG